MLLFAAASSITRSPHLTRAPNRCCAGNMRLSAAQGANRPQMMAQGMHNGRLNAELLAKMAAAGGNGNGMMGAGNGNMMGGLGNHQASAAPSAQQNNISPAMLQVRATGPQPRCASAVLVRPITMLCALFTAMQ